MEEVVNGVQFVMHIDSDDLPKVARGRVQETPSAKANLERLLVFRPFQARADRRRQDMHTEIPEATNGHFFGVRVPVKPTVEGIGS